MSAFIAFIVANWPVLLQILVGLLGVLAIIAKLTPTPKDDGVVAAILKFLNMLPIPSTASEGKAEDKDEPTPLL